MAEIKIEKKKAVWPWIIAILLIAAVIYFIYFRDNTADNQTETKIENTNGAANTLPNNKTVTESNSTTAAFETIAIV